MSRILPRSPHDAQSLEPRRANARKALDRAESGTGLVPLTRRMFAKICAILLAPFIAAEAAPPSESQPPMPVYGGPPPALQPKQPPKPADTEANKPTEPPAKAHQKNKSKKTKRLNKSNTDTKR